MLGYVAKSLRLRGFPAASPPCGMPMSMLKQRTLRAPIKTTGVGLHTGVRVDLTLRPAAPDNGVTFHRLDLDRPVAIPADALHVVDTRLSSTLEQDGVRVSTVEHILSALAGLGIDNLHIDEIGRASCRERV